MVLVGTKADLDHCRWVTYDDGKSLADEFGIPFFEVSAKTGLNVD